MKSTSTTSATAPFLRIPTEIRLIIFSHLLIDHDCRTLSIRTEHSSLYTQRLRENRLRTRYLHMADRFRARIMESTYHLKENPGIHPSILSVNRQIHDEAAHVLYSYYTFDFAIDIESIAPFLQDLTPTARSSIRRISILKRALPYTKDFDRCEWASACAYIAWKTHLTRLDLGIEGGKPLQQCKAQNTYTAAEYRLLVECESMEWAKQVCAIKGLDVLNVKAYLEHCPPPSNSGAMAFFVNFSASIEGGFAEYLRGRMVK